MEKFKSFFPLSFMEKKDMTALVINILIHLIVGVVIGVAVAALLHIPVVNIIVGTLSSLIGLYLTIGIILSVLNYLGIIRRTEK